MEEHTLHTVEEGLFSFVAGNLSLELVNTVSDYHLESQKDKLTDYRYLVEWAKYGRLLTEEQASGLLRIAAGDREAAGQALARARKLRDYVYRVFSAVAEGREPDAGDMEGLNAELGDAMCHALVKVDGQKFEWDWAGMGQSLDCILWPVARSAAELLVSDDLGRVRECAGDTCSWLFVDTSRNHSRQWCDMRDCGNRAKARRHYHRTKGDKS